MKVIWKGRISKLLLLLAFCPLVQRMHTNTLFPLALFPHGRTALDQNLALTKYKLNLERTQNSTSASETKDKEEI